MWVISDASRRVRNPLDESGMTHINVLTRFVGRTKLTQRVCRVTTNLTRLFLSVAMENIGKWSEIFVVITFVASISSTLLQKMLSIKVLLMRVTRVRRVITGKKLGKSFELKSSKLVQSYCNPGDICWNPQIYVLLFGSSEEIMVSKATVKFSTLISIHFVNMPIWR